MEERIVTIRQTAVGRIGISAKDGALVGLSFLQGEALCEDGASVEPLLDEAFSQLTAWLEGRLTTFSLPLAPTGTPFMHRVWTALLDIPYGSTSSYRDIAVAVGSPGGARAVGMACGRNPLPIFIPCHRVTGSGGRPGGYLGGIDLKYSLVELERSTARAMTSILYSYD
jgi:methylated-DNA-[protein]-cysteine S-methyltransferase